MKTLFITSILFFSTLMLRAQDASLPEGKSWIYLYSGKILKSVQLWKIEPMQIEYVVNGNLSDVKTTDVQKIETLDYIITFDENNTIQRTSYDLIIFNAGDTIKGIIRHMDLNYISFTQPGSDKVKTVMVSTVKKFVKPVATLEVIAKEEKSDLKRPLDTVIHIVSSVPKEPVREPELKLVVKDKAREEILNESYYHDSYERGVQDASFLNQSGWGVGTFFSGLFYGAPYISAAAANSAEINIVVPTGVDPRLYKEGYQNTASMKKVKSATSGAAAAKGIMTVFIIILIAVGL